MTTFSTALTRRIKQHIQAPTHEWFAPCAPGFEETLKAELAALGAEAPTSVPGGVEFKGKLDFAYQANLWLRTANRVLLRVARFKAKRPEDLFRHASGLAWELLLDPSVPLRFQTSSTASWLSNSDLIESTLRDAIRRRLKESHESLPETDPFLPEQLILVRMEQDEAVLSLDSSGEHLHRRGYRLSSSKAPLRETLAAGILQAAGYDGRMPLLDPMCGSGTFSIEAALMASHLPPGLTREFAFQRWPSFKEATWNHLCKKAREGAIAPSGPIVARDIHGGSLKALQENAERASVGGVIQIEKADFFTAPALDAPGLVVINPPYGKRVGEEEELGRFYRRMGDRLRSTYSGWRYAILVPQPWLVTALRLEPERRIRFSHGGLKIDLLAGRLP